MKIIVVGYGQMLNSIVLGIMRTQNKIVGVFRHDNVIKSAFKKKYDDIFRPSQDYNLVKTYNLYDIKANSVNSNVFRDEVKRLGADIIIIGSWSEKFSDETINSPEIACINVHPSLLPKFRGPNPYTQTILQGASKTGVTFHLMDSDYDNGDILYQASLPILKNDTGRSLKTKCCDLVWQELPYVLNNLPELMQKRTKQQEKDATYFHNVTVYDSIINFEKETSEEIDRRIRAFFPWLDCHIAIGYDFFTFSKYDICKEISVKDPATIAKKTVNEIFIVCKDGRLMKFSGLKSKRPFANLLSDFYFNSIIKENDKAR